MAGQFRFQKLTAWQKSMELARVVYGVSSGFPDSERFGLTSQIRRAVVSVSSNIAEGSGRSSDVDFARFLQLSYGSLMEVVSQLQLAILLGYCSTEDSTHAMGLAEEAAKVISGLRDSLVGPRKGQSH